jgi:hypothetical protein
MYLVNVAYISIYMTWCEKSVGKTGTQAEGRHVVIRASQGLGLTIYGPMIYTAPRIRILMQADGNREFCGPL